MTAPPNLPVADWAATKDTLHLYLQILGKLQLAHVPKRNHWWHATLRLAPRGVRTQTLRTPAGPIDVALDFVDHRAIFRCEARETAFDLRDGLSVGEFYRRTADFLGGLGVAMKIVPEPFDHPGSTTPFPDDAAHATYDPAAANHAHQLLAWVGPIFETFRGRFSGKASPVQLFWHHFDLAAARYNGDAAPAKPDAGRVEREAYSHAVVSSGFWFGDAKMPAPAFYSYTAPAPDGLTEQPIVPAAASWGDDGTALLTYADVLKAADPRAAVLDFLQSTYDAGAKTAGWDRDAFALIEPGVG